MRLGIIGCGNMGSALARGMLSKRVLPFNNIYVSDKDPAKTRELYKKFGIRVATNEEIADKCNFIVIAVKPQDSEKLLAAIQAKLNNSKHLISIMAGITMAKIEAVLKKRIAVTRAMPNMAAMVGKSTTCVSHNKAVREKAAVDKIFSSIGDVIEIDEKDMDAVTALSSSGLAYFFYLAECLIHVAKKLGLKKDMATKLAVDTLIGSGSLIEALDADPEVLRGRITSKRGVTEAAISGFKSMKFKGIVEAAVKRAAGRAGELSK